VHPDISTANIVTLFVIYIYARAVYGTFVYRKFIREENPDKKSSKWWLVPVVPVVLVIGMVLLYSVSSVVGFVPSTVVLAGSEIRDGDVKKLREQSIITDKEKVTHFYSEGLFSILEGGNVLTEDRVITYYRDDADELQVVGIPLSEVARVELVTQGDAMSESVYKVHSSRGRWISLYLSTEQKGDIPFVNELRDNITVKGQKNIAEVYSD